MFKILYQDNFIYYVLACDTTEEYIGYMKDSPCAEWVRVFRRSDMMQAPHIKVGDCYIWSHKDLAPKFFSFIDIKQAIQKGVFLYE